MLSPFFTVADSAALVMLQIVNILAPVFFHNYGNTLVGMKHSSGTPKDSYI